jgi:DNA replication and repair protein RecF
MIREIKLTDFRNFKKKSLEFSPNITVIVGPNGTGKTNILESLFLLSTGKSFKAKVEGEMIRYEQELARVEGSHFAKASRDDLLSLETIITEGRNSWPKKKLLVNGVPKRVIDFAGNFKTVLFGPWDVDLVTESPSLRRKFLDNVLSQTDREYHRSILSYEKGLRMRNKVLWRLREDPSSPFGRSGRSMLTFWNQLLIKTGNYITESREKFIEFVNTAHGLHTTDYSLEYDRSVISEGRLEQYAREEIASATTLVGPHRDDFAFIFEDRSLAAYGSRGQQRMGVLWLKMAELAFIENSGKNEGVNIGSARPTLLLDDIFSELDHEHRKIVMELANKQQTIITTTDENFLRKFKKFELVKL